MLEESLVKLCLEHSQSLSEAMLSENREESESLGWSSPTHCFSPLKGILGHLSVGKKVAPVLPLLGPSTSHKMALKLHPHMTGYLWSWASSNQAISTGCQGDA